VPSIVEVVCAAIGNAENKQISVRLQKHTIERFENAGRVEKPPMELFMWFCMSPPLEAWKWRIAPPRDRSTVKIHRSATNVAVR
jgi:hypothetical protein